MKVGIGQNNKDIDVTVDQLGLKTALGVELLNPDGSQVALDSGFKIPAYDDLVLGYTTGNLTSVTYKLSGSIVAVLTLTYDSSSNLTEVKRTT